MSSVPAAVEKQAKEAEKLQKELAEGKKKQKKDQPAAKDQKGQEQQQPAPPAQAEPTPPPAQQQPVQGEKPPEQGEPVDWEQKYKVLKGKYDAEVKADVSELRERLSALEAQNADLQQKLMEAASTIATLNQLIANGATGQSLGEIQQQQGAATADQQPPQTGAATEQGLQPLNEEDYEPYGEEMVGLVRNFNALIAENQRLRDAVASLYQGQKQTAEERFWNRLAEQVPDWESLNNDPGFLRWLGEVDMASGQTRKQLLDNHFYNMNPDGVAYFFNAYKQQAGLSAAPQQQQTPQQQQSQASAGAGLESQVMPDAAGAAPPPPAPGEVTVTREQMAKAAEDYTKGKITEDEFQKISDAFQRSLAKAFNLQQG
ncbi:MAG TPA: hypothetical protein ENG73_07410 [Desulfobacterales bacterium]|nr:hypothetical protein [Desulfobacterales bacterium]